MLCFFVNDYVLYLIATIVGKLLVCVYRYVNCITLLNFVRCAVYLSAALSEIIDLISVIVRMAVATFASLHHMECQVDHTLNGCFVFIESLGSFFTKKPKGYSALV